MDNEPNTTKVKVELSFTANLGNYQTFRVSIGLEDWQRSTDKNVDAAVDRVYDYLEKKLIMKLEETKSELDRYSEYH